MSALIGGGGVERLDRKETDNAWRVSISEVKKRDYNLDIKNPNKREDDIGDPEVLLSELKNAENKVAELRDELKSSLMKALIR